MRETYISASQKAEIAEDGLRFHVHLPPRTSWTVSLDVQASARATGDEPMRTKATVDAWVGAAPRLVCSWEPLQLIYRRSLVDMAALRFRTGITPGALPAAGLPWFMAVFGRDSLIASFQAIPFAPELAASTLRTLALFQGRVEDPFRDEEPGKILHELRLGELTAFEERPHSPYYGAADSTMLFLIVLEEYVRWTGDRALARELEREARAAVTWIDRYGDRDHDGFVEYKRGDDKTGLDNQCWKDSWDSIAFADGTIAPLPRATCELQGYVYDAKLRTARLAREVWNDPVWAKQLETQAVELKKRFNQEFWIPERNFFALALDGQKRKVDSLTSNIGHLLWSGIADDEKAESCVKHLMSDALFSGWGIRTMASSENSYNPIGYHVGTVWPHDNSFIAWGLRQIRLPRRSGPHLARHAGGGPSVRRPAPRGVRRLSPLGHPLPGRVPDGVQPAGLGDRRAAAAHSHAARPRVRRNPPDRRPGHSRAAGADRAARHPGLSGGAWTPSAAPARPIDGARARLSAFDSQARPAKRASMELPCARGVQ